jgi:protein-tyrosine-phosphatase
MKANDPHSVLFACTLNSVRSPMAEALARRHFGQRIYVDSAGLSTSDLDGFAIAAMEEIGIDMRDHNTQGFDDIDLSEFDLVIALSPEAHARAEALTQHSSVKVEYWPIQDPTRESGGSRESRLHAYRQVRDDIRQRIRARFPING